MIDVVGMYEERQLEPEKIAEKFDVETEEVYAALVYYYEHPRDIRRQLNDQRNIKALYS